MPKNLPEPSCELGYTIDQLREIMGDRFDFFTSWMRGQTMAICDGTRYDYDLKESIATGCGPHGTAVYRWDVERFLDGRPAVD